jgi:phosphate transport system substrate-binding protein
MRLLLFGVALVLALPASRGDVPAPAAALPPYVPSRQFEGTIRSWGHGFLKPMMRLWEAGFQVYQPKVRFKDDLVSSAAAMAGLYSGRADLGVLAREITPPEVAAYEKVTRQKIFPVTVLTGSLGNPDKIMALGVFLAKDNPIDRLSFRQLDAIFGSERRRGAPASLRTWGDLGLSGEWRDRPIHPYSGPAYEAPGYYFSQTVLGGSVLWNCDLRQYDDLDLPGGQVADGYQRVIDAAGADRGGIALTGAGYRNPAMKAVALGREEGGPYVLPTRETVASLAYPLGRPVRFYIHHGPAIPPNPLVIEFLRYVLSRQGQAQVRREGDFLPVPPAVAGRELARLASAP